MFISFEENKLLLIKSMFSNIKRLFLKAAWAPFAILLLHNGISKFFGHKPSLDPTMHLLGGFAIAYFFYQAIQIGNTWFGNPKPMAHLFLTYCISVTVTVFWEFLEFAGDRTTGGKVQSSVTETMYDLLLGSIGALLFLIISAILYNRKHS
jgi:hypothetical protein